MGLRMMTMLWANPNPFENIERPEIDDKAANCLTIEEARRFLRAIPLETVRGWRDLCIVSGPLILGRRLSEWLPLRRCDIHDEDGAPWFTYSRHIESKSQPLPLVLWNAIQMSLHQAKRWPLASDDYLFTALSANASTLPQLDSNFNPHAQPLSQRTVNQSLRVYARKAGLTHNVNARVLWRTGIALRRQRGASVLELHELLGHVNVAVTRAHLDTYQLDSIALFDELAPPSLKKHLA